MLESPPAIALPIEHHFVHTLQQIFAAQAREIVSRYSIPLLNGDVSIDMSHWLPTMLTHLKPFTLRNRLVGMRRGDLKLSHALRAQPARKGILTATGAPSTRNIFVGRQVKKDVLTGISWDLVNPKVVAAVDDATMLFCRETNDTATMRLNEAIAKLRAELKEGLSQGEALRTLSRRVATIFADPSRAFLIANTESARATYAGEQSSWKESGVCQGSRWICSADACPQICLPLDLEEREFGEPFAIIGKNPAYSHIYHPPAHPACRCAATPILAAAPAKTTFLPPPEDPQRVTVSAQNTAGQHPADPWANLAPQAEALAEVLAKDKDAKRKAKAFASFVNPHQAEFNKAEQAKSDADDSVAIRQAKYAAVLEQSKIVHVPPAIIRKAEDDYNAATANYAKAKTDLAVAKARMESEQTDHLMKTLKAKKPVKVEPSFPPAHAPGPKHWQTKVQEVCDVLSSILNQSSAGEHALYVPFDLIPLHEDQRAHYDPRSGKVMLTAATKKNTIAHEVGHALQNIYPKAGEAVRAFWHKRCDGKPRTMMSQFGGNYNVAEVGCEDDFWKVFGRGTPQAAYAGKVYKNGDQTELLSMGLQALLDDPKRMAQADPEWFALITGILAGKYR